MNIFILGINHNVTREIGNFTRGTILRQKQEFEKLLNRPATDYDAFAINLASLRCQIFVDGREAEQRTPRSGGQHNEDIEVCCVEGFQMENRSYRPANGVLADDAIDLHSVNHLQRFFHVLAPSRREPIAHKKRRMLLIPNSECDYLTQGKLAGVSSGSGAEAGCRASATGKAIHRNSLCQTQRNSERQSFLPLGGDLPGDEIRQLALGATAGKPLVAPHLGQREDDAIRPGQCPPEHLIKIDTAGGLRPDHVRARAAGSACRAWILCGNMGDLDGAWTAGNSATEPLWEG